MAYNYHDALKRRLEAINELGEEASTWEILRAQKQREKRMAGEQSLYNQTANSRRGWNGQAGFKSTGDASFDKFLAAISGQESGGNYGARNKGSDAMGKYQIMPGNLGGARSGWDYEALGYDVSPAQFMSSPEIQEAIAQHKLRQYYNQWGPEGAAVAWYSGPGNVARKLGSTRAQKGGPSISGYRQAILRRMGR